MFKSKFSILGIFRSFKSKATAGFTNLINFQIFISKLKSGFESFPNFQKKYVIYFVSLIIFFGFYIFIVTQFKYYNKLKENNFRSFLSSTEFKDLKQNFIGSLRSPYKEYKYIIKNNDTIEKILKSYDVEGQDLKNLSAKLKEKKLSDIFSGTELNIVLKEDEGKNKIISIFYPVTEIKTIEIKKENENFNISENVLKLDKIEVVKSNTIKNNLYSAAIESGIEPNVIIDFANIYGFEVDFQRDIRIGDRFEVYYERYVDENQITRKTGKIIYTSMFVNNKELALYNFKYKNKKGYYDIDGKSVIKTLMKTPINGARLSSGFGFRKHPILGFNKMHQGTDFAAPRGTPIMASGSGLVEMAQKYKGYGNFIRIRHNSTYKTAYAHLSKFAKGIRKGVRVNQGQIIGYVGSTGMSTGPHLHYEVIKNGKKINSQRMKLPKGKALDKEARNVFELERINIDVKVAKLRANKN